MRKPINRIFSILLSLVLLLSLLPITASADTRTVISNGVAVQSAAQSGAWKPVRE